MRATGDQVELVLGAEGPPQQRQQHQPVPVPEVLRPFVDTLASLTLGGSHASLNEETGNPRANTEPPSPLGFAGARGSRDVMHVLRNCQDVRVAHSIDGDGVPLTAQL
mmetsp:Transcript_58446/g.162958  ORF Transcript_58446/g.162958 Transcript_58446/m.162958 type:complete len:108 (+) Transcript_58446:3-326(+)